MSGLQAHLVVHRGDFELDIEFTIARGETIALLGPNGAGKTTAVEALAGAIPLDGGLIDLAGRLLDDPSSQIFLPPEARRIGIVFQDYLLFDHLSVLDNVAFGPASQGAPRATRRAAAGTWLEALRIGDLATRRPTELSGGQAQRVALARALASEPELLLLDEPLAALDIQSRTGLRRTLQEHLALFGGPRLLITHDPTDAFLLADRIVIVEAGRITQVGTPMEIRNQPATRYIADLAGTNLFSGTAKSGDLVLDDAHRPIRAANTEASGPVLVTIHPRAVSLHLQRPEGSQRNVWETTVDRVEPLGDTTRIQLAEPVPLRVDITPEATAALDLRPGAMVWAAVKATEVEVNPT